MPEQFTPHTNRTKQFLFIGVSALLVIGLAVAAFFLLMKDDPKPKEEGVNPHNSRIVELEKQSPPTSPMQLALYYGQIGQAYRELSEYDTSIKNFLEAQKVIEQNGLESQYVFYQAIADTYAAKGDKVREKTYLEKQLAYLQDFQKTNPNDGGATLDGIKVLEERIRGL